MVTGAIGGFVDDRFTAVRTAFEHNLASDGDVGAAFCATVHGETVVDLWGGFADADKSRAWERDTIVNVYSTTKTITALCVLILADRGALDFDAPVARYWPEFAANGKDTVTVAQIMGHTAGLSGWKEPITSEDLYDWDKVTGLLAAQSPFWTPGTASGYHAVTQGYLLGELVRRVTGKTIGTFFREEIALPLGADFYIGLPASEDGRVAELIPAPPPPADPAAWGAFNAMQINIATNPGVIVAEHGTRAWRGAEIPAAGGTGNARGVAQVLAILANGGELHGKRYLGEATIRKALVPQSEGADLVLGMPARFGLGFALAGGALPAPGQNILYWGGFGGSLAIVDLDARTSCAYVMNNLVGPAWDARALGLLAAMWQSLGLA